MSNHLSLRSLVFDLFLVQLCLVITIKSLNAQGTAIHLESHCVNTEPRERIRSKLVNLQVEPLQNFTKKILAGGAQPRLKEVAKNHSLIRLGVWHLVTSRMLKNN